MCAGPWISALHGEVLVTFQQGSRSDQRHQPEMALYVPENQAPSVFSNPGSFGCVMQGDINGWDLSSIRGSGVKQMFWHAISFNAPLNAWDTGSITTLALSPDGKGQLARGPVDDHIRVGVARENVDVRKA